MSEGETKVVRGGNEGCLISAWSEISTEVLVTCLVGKNPYRVAVVAMVNFGEKTAGSTATAVEDRIAKVNEHISPEVSKI